MTTTQTAPQTWQTGHVGLNVTDLDRSLRFYQQAFGLQVVRASDEPGRAFALLGDGTRLVLTLWQQSEGAFQTATPGLHHLSFQVETMDTVREMEQRLQAMGVRFLYDGAVPHSEGGASGGIFFADPDGIRLEIYSPTGADGLAAPVHDAPSCGFF